MISQIYIGNYWSVGESSGNNAWNYYGPNGRLNNNNKYNAFLVRPSLDLSQYNNGRLLDYLIPLNEFYKIVRKCRQKKRLKPSCLVFDYNMIHNLIPIVHEVNNYEYVPRPAVCFLIFIPRIREIMAADFTDRCVQTLYVNVLVPYLERFWYHKDSYACRIGKGGLRAVLQLQEYIFEMSKGYTRNVWLAKIDIKAFFMSIDTKLAADKMCHFINTYLKNNPYKEILVYLTRIIYQSLPQEHCHFMSPRHWWLELPNEKSSIGKTDKSVCIGNVTSQVIASFLTTVALYYIDSLGYKFAHYSDDTAIVVTDKKQWTEDLERIERLYRNNLELTLHPNKRYLQHYSKGIQFLGYKLRFDRVLPGDRVCHNFDRIISVMIARAVEDKKCIYTCKESFMQTINSYLGYLRWCNAYRLRRDSIERIKASAWSEVFDFADDYTSVSVKCKYTRLAHFIEINKKRRHYYQTTT